MEKNWENFLENLPAGTGVYLMKDAGGKVIYVGKAVNLRNRVKSYFREGTDTRPGVVFLMKRVADIQVILTDTEKESLILENNLIKEHRPRYNFRLRDDKDFFSLRLATREKYPRLIMVRRPDNSDEPTFGPYASSTELRQTLKLIMDIFPLRTCKPAEFRKRTRPCLNHQMGRCLGACVGLVSEEVYGAMVENIKRFLKGHTEEVVADLELRMKEASEAMDYEMAARYRDQIRAIRTTVERQKMLKHGGADRDVIGFARKGDRTVAVRMRFREGKLVGTSSFDIKTPGRADAEVSSELIRRLYAEAAIIPAEIFVTPEPEDCLAISEWLSEKKGGRITIRGPQRGEGRELAELAEKNAREALEATVRREFDPDIVLQELMRRLDLKSPPELIECVDISNIGGKQAVGSMVAFSGAMPDKSRYRRYKIRNIEGQDDYAMMYEVLERRLKRGIEERNLPDLILVDGGKGQLNIARQVIADLCRGRPLCLPVQGRGEPQCSPRHSRPLCLPVQDIGLAAIAKNREGKSGDRIFIPGRKNHVPLSAPAMHLLARIRDEAHRFAITYHRGLRKRETLTSALLDIPGIGPKKRNTLLKHFGSLKRVSEATLEELEAAPGIAKKDAAEIVNFFNAPQDQAKNIE